MGRLVLALTVLALAGCHHSRLTVGGTGDAAAAPAAPDTAPAPADGAAPDATAADEAPSPDVGPDGPDPVLPYRQFLQQQNDTFYGRWADCFGTPRALLPIGDRAQDLGPYLLEDSVRLGLVTVDPEGARRCLEALMTASCERIADIGAHDAFAPRNRVLPECDGVLVGQIPPGKACQRTEECQSADQYACVGDYGCGRVCTPRVLRPAGAGCSDDDRCAAGTTCRYGPKNGTVQQCLAPLQEGSTCMETYQCAAGLLCAERTATSVFEGTCRPIKVGTPCAGNWECPFAHVCEGAGPVTRGTCQVAKAIGAACTTYLADVNGNVYSNCPPLTDCLDLDGKGPRCVAGSSLGQSCGELHPGRDNAWLQCLEGYCDIPERLEPRVGTCRPHNAIDSACSDDQQCTPPSRCLKVGTARRCALDELPAAPGTPCSLTGEECGRAAYCAVSPDYDPLNPVFPTKGVCTPLKRAGEACREGIDSCEPLAFCTQGVCQKC